ncbi:HAD family hydrolase [Streptococcus dentiloxodontae]
MTVSAVFFDLDGVIFDSYDLWDRVVEKLLKNYGIHYHDFMRQRLWQLSMTQINAYLLELINQKVTEKELEERKMAIAKELYSCVTLIDGARDILLFLKRQGVAAYAVTSNYGRLADLGLRSADVNRYFVKIYSSLDQGYTEKNTAFLQNICQQENLLPQEIVMVEDDGRNLAIAAQLGISGILMKNKMYPNEKGGTDTIIGSLHELKDKLAIDQKKF